MLAAAGVPESTAVPADEAVKVTPAGRVPASEIVGAGAPLASTTNDEAWPTGNAAPSAVVKVGARTA